MLIGSLRRPLGTFLHTGWICRRCYSSSSKTVGLTPARTRFAPSPTGSLHLGSLRTALYNYLWAKRTKGQFILRVEDTDQTRLVPGAEDSLHDTLRWAGLRVDEGPEHGGPHAPYRQSERLSIYREHIQTLLENGTAYRCFCTPDRLASLRSHSRKQGQSGTYDRKCFAVSREESDTRASSSEPHVIRLRSPEAPPMVEDLVHGTVNFGNAKQAVTFDDAILIKSDGFPTYHFANVVDDHLMHITHVIRGEEWLTSTPKHLAIYAAFGWTPPEFAHVPLLASIGGAKLSKRHGDTSVEAFREKGLLPEALLNYLALMGWNAHIAPAESEVMTLAEMVGRFDLSQITKGATIVTPDKLTFLQKQHYHRLAEDADGVRRLVAQTQTQLHKTFETRFSDEYVRRVIVALKDRIVDPLGVPHLGSYFFRRPDFECSEAIKFTEKFSKVSGNTSLTTLLQTIAAELSDIGAGDWTGTEFNLTIESLFRQITTVPHNTVIGAARYAVAGGLSGAGVKQIMEIIGREETLARFRMAIEFQDK